MVKIGNINGKFGTYEILECGKVFLKIDQAYIPANDLNDALMLIETYEKGNAWLTIEYGDVEVTVLKKDIK